MTDLGRPGRLTSGERRASQVRVGGGAPRHRDFATLYGIVTREMVRYGEDRRRAGAVGDVEAAWFIDLVRRFEREFDRWDGPAADAGVASCLAALDTLPRVVRLAGRVFLHIGYDLPRVVRASLDAWPALDRRRAQALYDDAAPLLSLASMRAATPWYRVALVRAAGHGPAADALAAAVQAMRASAWAAGAAAHDVRPARAAFDGPLIDVLREAVADAIASAGRTPQISSRVARLRAPWRPAARDGDARTIAELGRAIDTGLARVSAALRHAA